jgi:hypothetical protein
LQQSVTFVDFGDVEGRRKREEGRRKRGEGRGKKEEGRGKLCRKKARSPEAGRNAARRGSASSSRRQTAPAKHSQAKLGERA